MSMSRTTKRMADDLCTALESRGVRFPDDVEPKEFEHLVTSALIDAYVAGQLREVKQLHQQLEGKRRDLEAIT